MNILKVHILIHLLVFTSKFLFAQTWSDPIVITPNGLNYETNFTVDKLGRIHCVWAHEISIYFRQIYYARSDDGGNTWLFKTQMSSNNTHWLGKPNIVTDSNANPYVSYDYMIESYGKAKVCFKKATGALWGPQISVTEEMLGSEDNLIAIDKNDKVCFFWKFGRRVYYRFLTNDNLSSIFTPYSGGIFGYFFVKTIFDDNNILHCVGSLAQNGGEDNKVTYFKFEDENWDDYIFISDSLWNNGLMGMDMCMNQPGKPQIIWSQWSSKATHTPYFGFYTYIEDSIPSPRELFTQESLSLAITMDRNDKKHIVACEYHVPMYQLVHYFNDGQSWAREVIEQNYANYLNISLITHDSTLYLLYIKQDTILAPNYQNLTKILFRKLDVVQGIKSDFNGSTLKAFPNPFSNQLSLCSNIPFTGLIHIKVFDIFGRQIFSSEIYTDSNAPFSFRWNSLDNNKQNICPGIYFITATNGYFSLYQRVIKN
jgi:hypothetical protein